MKKLFISIIAAAMSLIPNVNANNNNDLDRFYNMKGTVTFISPERETGTITTSNGNKINIDYVSDWEDNDTVNCILDSKGTPEVEDDEIISAYYTDTTIEVELIKRVYDENLDVIICTFCDADGNEYVIKDTTAPYKSKCTLTLDTQGKPTKIVVESVIEDYQLQ